MDLYTISFLHIGGIIMEMKIHLHEDVFEIVKKGIKDIEVRINDEKRRKLHIGDTLIFLKRPLEDEEIRATVTGLEYYNNFSELVDNYDMKRLYLENYTKEMYLNEMKRFYTDEEQLENGVVAIIFRKEK
ncbi:MAG TPA: hypothetical protein DCE23_03910 [Firmicutes bacterium]|nr:hypothetical protein [Bacillota bacterium]